MNPIDCTCDSETEQTLTFQPGTLGFTLQTPLSLHPTITMVDESEAQHKNIQKGWTITKINGQCYGGGTLLHCMEGASMYNITFETSNSEFTLNETVLCHDVSKDGVYVEKWMQGVVVDTVEPVKVQPFGWSSGHCFDEVKHIWDGTLKGLNGAWETFFEGKHQHMDVQDGTVTFRKPQKSYKIKDSGNILILKTDDDEILEWSLTKKPGMVRWVDRIQSTVEWSRQRNGTKSIEKSEMFVGKQLMVRKEFQTDDKYQKHQIPVMNGTSLVVKFIDPDGDIVVNRVTEPWNIDHWVLKKKFLCFEGFALQQKK